MPTVDELEYYTKDGLIHLCNEYELSTDGSKEDLIKRLTEYLKEHQTNDPKITEAQKPKVTKGKRMKIEAVKALGFSPPDVEAFTPVSPGEVIEIPVKTGERLIRTGSAKRV